MRELQAHCYGEGIGGQRPTSACSPPRSSSNRKHPFQQRDAYSSSPSSCGILPRAGVPEPSVTDSRVILKPVEKRLAALWSPEPGCSTAAPRRDASLAPLCVCHETGLSMIGLGAIARLAGRLTGPGGTTHPNTLAVHWSFRQASRQRLSIPDEELNAYSRYGSGFLTRDPSVSDPVRAGEICKDTHHRVRPSPSLPISCTIVCQQFGVRLTPVWTAFAQGWRHMRADTHG
jgi:hypothetical protein